MLIRDEEPSACVSPADGNRRLRTAPVQRSLYPKSSRRGAHFARVRLTRSEVHSGHSQLTTIPQSMPILRYFWFLCAAMMAVNVIIWRRRLLTVVSRGTASQNESDRFVRGAGVWLIGVPILLGLIALAAGWSSPFCAGILQFDTLSRTLTSGVIVVSWLVFLAWIWRGHGAEFLARVGPALTQRADYERAYSVRGVRLVVTAAILLPAVSASVAWRSMPASP